MAVAWSSSDRMTKSDGEGAVLGLSGPFRSIGNFRCSVDATFASKGIIQFPITSWIKRDHSVCQASTNRNPENSGHSRCSLSVRKWVMGVHSVGKVWYLWLPCCCSRLLRCCCHKCQVSVSCRPCSPRSLSTLSTLSWLNWVRSVQPLWNRQPSLQGASHKWNFIVFRPLMITNYSVCSPWNTSSYLHSTTRYRPGEEEHLVSPVFLHPL